MLTWNDIETWAKEWEGRGPRLAQYAEFINANFPQYEARMERWSYTPHRHLYAHVGSFGKRQEGKRLAVRLRGDSWARDIYTHNPLEPYRHNTDVARWIWEHRGEAQP